jgi:hypothetical protein
MTPTVLGQNAVDDVLDTQYQEVPNAEEPPIALETITRISTSTKVFVITNNQNSYFKGDFITLLFNKKPICRAIVAKIENNLSGIKIVKLYSLALWEQLRVGVEVQVVRGDDSYFLKSQEKKEEVPTKEISTEEDLYNETLLDDDLSLDENKNRAIKTDNILGLAYGLIQGLDNDGSAASYRQFMGKWAFQVSDDIWIEGMYGQNLVAGYPSKSLDTTFSSFAARIKYTIQAPFFSYVQPYVGYQIIGALSQGAGKNPTVTETPADMAAEVNAVEALKRKNVVFGVTILKRLVPGWFFYMDLGADIVNGGFSLEF